MYRSLRLLKVASSSPLANPALRTSFRPTPLGNSLAFQRVLSTSTRRLASEPITGDRDGHKDKHNVENQNYTSTAREELKSMGKDFAEIVSGRSHAPSAAEVMGKASEKSHGAHGSIADDYRTLTTELFSAVPKPALYFGLAGTIPYLGTSVGTVFLAREAMRASQGLNTITGLDLQGALDNLHILEHVQITYGAIILSFLGAIHWGMEFSKQGGVHGYSRLALGVIPVLYAWPTTFLPHSFALVAQWFGFTGTWMLDQRASLRGWTTPWYSTYRFYLSLVVGFSIMATFAGTGFYGAGAGASTALHYPTREAYSERMSGFKRLDKVGEKNRATSPKAHIGRIEGTTTSDVTLEENTDSYTKLVKAAEPEEEEEEEDSAGDEGADEGASSKDDQKQKNAEFQDKRDEHMQNKSPEGMKKTAKDRTGANENVQSEEDKSAR